MSEDGKTALVCAPVVALVKHESALVRRGLNDLARFALRKARVLLVNDHRTLLEEMERILTAGRYEVCSTHRYEDAANLASAFLEARGLRFEPFGHWVQHGLPAREFDPQFLMVGASTPTALIEQLWNLHVSVGATIFWGEQGELESLERRLGYCPDALAIPLDGDEVLHRMGLLLAEAWTTNGCSLDAAERHLEAFECHEKALGLDPLCVSAWINRGNCLNRMGRPAEAVQSYEKAAEADPSDYRPWVRKASVLLNYMTRPEEAVQACDTALRINPAGTAAWQSRGDALQDLGRCQEAILCYDRIIAMDLTAMGSTAYGARVYSDAWSAKGRAFGRMGRHEDSIACCDKAISLDPDLSVPYRTKALCLEQLRRFEDAIRCYDKALELSQGKASYWNDKAVCLGMMGKFEESILCCENALASEVPPVLGWYYKAYALESLGRMQEAASCYEKYLVLAPTEADPGCTEYAKARLLDFKSKTKASRQPAVG